MIFKFPKKKLVLDCFTHHEYIAKTAPILPAIKVIPDWWRGLPSSFYEESFHPFPTMKNCVGMIEYYKKSIVIPMWSELAVSIEPNGMYRWQFSDGTTEAKPHDITKQATGFLNDYAHLKISSPWLLRTKEDISWVWSHPTYSYPKSHNIVSLPAIVKYNTQFSTNINILISRKEQGIITIPQGQPMVFMTPMSDKKVEIVRHVISKEEWDTKNAISNSISFIDKYRVGIKKAEQFSDCPFHNHTKGN